MIAAPGMNGSQGITAGFSPFFNPRSRETGTIAPHQWDFGFQEAFPWRKKAEAAGEEESSPVCVKIREIPSGWQEQIAGLEKLVKASSARGREDKALEYVQQIDRVMKKIFALSTAISLAGIVAARRNRPAWRGAEGMNRQNPENYRMTELKAA